MKKTKSIIAIGAVVVFILFSYFYNQSEGISAFPPELQGRWIETSDDVLEGFKKPDVFELGPASMIHTIHTFEGEADVKTLASPRILKFKHSYKVYFPSKLFGEEIFRLCLEDSGSFLHVTGIIELNDGRCSEQEYGRYVKRDIQ